MNGKKKGKIYYIMKQKARYLAKKFRKMIVAAISVLGAKTWENPPKTNQVKESPDNVGFVRNALKKVEFPAHN